MSLPLVSLNEIQQQLQQLDNFSINDHPNLDTTILHKTQKIVCNLQKILELIPWNNHILEIRLDEIDDPSACNKEILSLINYRMHISRQNFHCYENGMQNCNEILEITNLYSSTVQQPTKEIILLIKYTHDILNICKKEQNKMIQNCFDMAQKTATYSKYTFKQSKRNKSIKILETKQLLHLYSKHPNIQIKKITEECIAIIEKTECIVREECTVFTTVGELENVEIYEQICKSAQEHLMKIDKHNFSVYNEAAANLHTLHRKTLFANCIELTTTIKNIAQTYNQQAMNYTK